MFFIIMILLAIGIAGHLFATEVTKDIKCILQAIDENSRTKERRKRIYKQFREFIDVHSAIKQLSCLLFQRKKRRETIYQLEIIHFFIHDF